MIGQTVESSLLPVGGKMEESMQFEKLKQKVQYTHAIATKRSQHIQYWVHDNQKPSA